MGIGRLSQLQGEILSALASIEPRWTLSGGGALVGFHTKHRETRDLDLFFHGERALGEVVADARRALEAAGLVAAPLRTTATFAQLDVRSGRDAVVVDLVADPTPVIEPADARSVDDRTILVETAHQLLVNKLCALLGRSELRDLVDVKALLDAGGDLVRALADSPRQDAGFSPLTFAWTARGLPVERLAAALGWPAADGRELAAFRDDLVDRVLSASRP